MSEFTKRHESSVAKVKSLTIVISSLLISSTSELNLVDNIQPSSRRLR